MVMFLKRCQRVSSGPATPPFKLYSSLLVPRITTVLVLVTCQSKMLHNDGNIAVGGNNLITNAHAMVTHRNVYRTGSATWGSAPPKAGMNLKKKKG